MKKAILAAIGYDRLREALDLAAKKPFVVFGSLDGDVLGRLGEIKPGDRAVSGARVYFYNYD